MTALHLRAIYLLAPNLNSPYDLLRKLLNEGFVERGVSGPLGIQVKPANSLWSRPRKKFYLQSVLFMWGKTYGQDWRHT